MSGRKDRGMEGWKEGRMEGWRKDKGMKQGKEGKVIEQINRVPDRKTERRMENLTEGQREQWGWVSAEMARKTKREPGSK